MCLRLKSLQIQWEIQPFIWTFKNVKLNVHAFGKSLLELMWHHLRGSSAPSVQVRKAWGSEVLSFCGRVGGWALCRKCKGVCVSAQCGVHFHLSLWAGSGSFCQKSLKIHLITTSYRRLMILQREHSFQRARVSVGSHQETEGSCWQTQNLRSERNAMKRHSQNQDFTQNLGWKRTLVKSTGKGSIFKWCTWCICSELYLQRFQNTGYKGMVATSCHLICDENRSGHSEQSPDSSNVTDRAHTIILHEEELWTDWRRVLFQKIYIWSTEGLNSGFCIC
jgi:hypothetical protein